MSTKQNQPMAALSGRDRVAALARGLERIEFGQKKAAAVPLHLRLSLSPEEASALSGIGLTSIRQAAASGALIALNNSAGSVYIINVIGALLCALLIFLVKTHHKVAAKEPMSLKNVAAGLKFVYRTKIVLGSITLDMFAVLLGGATALLPVYSKDILHAGPRGLGWLQAAARLAYRHGA